MSVREVLIVDGYNIIKIWQYQGFVKMIDNDRDKQDFIVAMTNLQGYSGMKVVLVFDAQFAPGKAKKQSVGQLEIHYSGHEQTADNLIERLVGDYISQGFRVTVATADHLEQIITFAKGALRMSPPELWLKISELRNENKSKLKTSSDAKTSSKLEDSIDKNVLDALLKIRDEKSDT
jgi:hypothetical protein